MYVCMYVCMYKCLGPDPTAPVFYVRMETARAAWCARLRLTPLILICCLQAPVLQETLTQSHKLQLAPGQRKLKERDGATTSVHGSQEDLPSVCVNWRWRKPFNKTAAAPGRSLAASALAEDDARGTTRKVSCILPCRNWTDRLAVRSDKTMSYCRNFTMRRFPATTRPGFFQTWLDGARTLDVARLSKGCSFCCSARWCPDFTPLDQNSYTEPSTTLVAGCTAILSGWFGRCLQMMTDAIFNNGITVAPKSHRLLKLSGQSRMGQSLLVGRETQRHIPDWKPAHELRVQPAGRPGPKSGGNCRQRHQRTTSGRPRPSVYTAEHQLRILEATIADTRVGGSLGQSPPEVVEYMTHDFTKQTKLFGPTPTGTRDQVICIPRECKTSISLTFFQLQYDVFYMDCILDPQTPSPQPNAERQDGFATRPRFKSGPGCPAQVRNAEPLRIPHSASVQLILLCYLGLRALERTAANTHRARYVLRIRPGLFCRRLCNCERRRLLIQQVVGTASRSHRSTPRPRPEHPKHGPIRLGFRTRPIWTPTKFLLTVCLVMQAPTSSCAFPQTQPATHSVPMPTTSAAVVRAFGQQAVMLTSSSKRSFKRAQRKAIRDGYARYKGRLHTPESLALRQVTPTVSVRPSPKAPLQAGALRCISWNAGGLHAGRYSELLGWLDEQFENPVHVACIQETHWPQWSEFQSANWVCVHSGSGEGQAGILFLINKKMCDTTQIKHAELLPGRILHLRLPCTPPVDLLGVYQYAWNPNQKSLSGSVQQRQQALLAKRDQVWQAARQWLGGIPKRNAVLILGDMNATLRTELPHVGYGVAPHPKETHPDQAIFQGLVASLGLTAINSWGKHGYQAGTFLQQTKKTVQLDYFLTRLPCQPHAMRAQALKQSPVVHPTGMRHVPIECYFPHRDFMPASRVSSTPTAKQVRQLLAADQSLGPKFVSEFQQLASQQHAQQHPPNIEDNISQAWQQARKACRAALPCQQHPSKTGTPIPTLKTFWECKQQLRNAMIGVERYNAPVLWYISTAAADTVCTHAPRSLQRARSLFACWRAAVRFHLQDKHFRKQARKKKEQQVDQLIQTAEQAEKRGISQLQQLTKTLRPKSSKRTIHFRGDSGQLLTAPEELQRLEEFFSELYLSQQHTPRAHALQKPLQITTEEVAQALSHMSARKALPPGHMPAVLWKLAGPALVPVLCESYNRTLSQGVLRFPQRWHDTFMTLIPKPGKAPDRPAHLRPICLLPAEAKLLARIAAERLRPYLHQALPSRSPVCLQQCTPNGRCH